MSAPHPHTVLVIGGVKSGKSEFAESLAAASTSVRYIATAAMPDTGESDPEWAARIEAHRERRPAHWETDDVGATPGRLAAMIKSGADTDTLLVDDVGGWFAAQLDAVGEGATPDADSAIEDLVAAVQASAARLILVSPEVGLSLVATTPVGRWFADAVGSANRRLADVVDAVALVVAGRAVWLPERAASTVGGEQGLTGKAQDVDGDIVIVKQFARAEKRSADVFAAVDDLATGTMDEIHVGMSVPQPDAIASAEADTRIQRMPVAGPGIGGLAPLVRFAAGTQAGDVPRPFGSVRVIALTGTHLGGIGAGGTVPSWAHPDTADDSVLARLASASGEVTIELLDTGVARPLESGDAMDEAELAGALAHGWRRAQAAADRGDDVIVLAAGGPGVEAAAAAVLAGITRAEVPALLPRVYGPAGVIDDDAWMSRCLAIRDAVARLGSRPQDGPTALLALGGPSIATATGVLLGAASRRTPVIIDGPVGATAALAARDYAAQVRLWCLLTDIAGDPATRFAADRLGLEPTVSVGLGLGEGANALALLPTFQSVLNTAGVTGDEAGADETAADETATDQADAAEMAAADPAEPTPAEPTPAEPTPADDPSPDANPDA